LHQVPTHGGRKGVLSDAVRCGPAVLLQARKCATRGGSHDREVSLVNGTRVQAESARGIRRVGTKTRDRLPSRDVQSDGGVCVGRREVEGGIRFWQLQLLTNAIFTSNQLVSAKRAF